MSSVVQQDYRPQIAAGVIGMIADEQISHCLTRICGTAAGIPFGRAVSSQAGNPVKGAIIGGSKFLGISARDITLIPGVPISPNVDSFPPADVYPQYVNMAVMDVGHIWVEAQADVTEDDPLYYETTGGTLSNNASGTAAAGNVVYTTNPLQGDTFAVTGPSTTTTVTFETGTPSGEQVQIGVDLGQTLNNLATFLNASADANLALFEWVAYPPSPEGPAEGFGANEIQYGAKAVGTAANAFAVVASTAGATVTALAGGTAAATAITGGYWLDTAIAGDIARVSLGIAR